MQAAHAQCNDLGFLPLPTTTKAAALSLSSFTLATLAPPDAAVNGDYGSLQWVCRSVMYSHPGVNMHGLCSLCYVLHAVCILCSTWTYCILCCISVMVSLLWSRQDDSCSSTCRHCLTLMKWCVVRIRTRWVHLAVVALDWAPSAHAWQSVAVRASL